MSRGSISNFRRIKKPKLHATQSDTNVLTCTMIQMIQRATTWVPKCSVLLKQHSQNYQQHTDLSPFPYSHHWSRRALPPPALSWAHLDWFWMPACGAARQKSDRRKEIGTLFMLLYITSKAKGWKISTNTVSFNNLLFLFSCPCYEF